jgi:hypothetical protein
VPNPSFSSPSRETLTLCWPLSIEYFPRLPTKGNFVQTKKIVMATAKGKAQKVTATPIRVTLPLSVACDLEKFQTALANVAALVGAMNLACRPKAVLPRTREFVIDPASLEVKEAAAEQ